MAPLVSETRKKKKVKKKEEELREKTKLFPLIQGHWGIAARPCSRDDGREGVLPDRFYTDHLLAGIFSKQSSGKEGSFVPLGPSRRGIFFYFLFLFRVLR